MAKINIGDKVRVKGRDNWPKPPGFVLAGAEGTVVKWVESDNAMKEFGDYLYVRLEKAKGKAKVYIGNNTFFREEDLEKIT